MPAIEIAFTAVPVKPPDTLAPALINIPPLTVIVVPVLPALYSNMPDMPLPTVRLVQVNVSLTTSFAPLFTTSDAKLAVATFTVTMPEPVVAIITSSPATGAIPPTHVVPSDQFPPSVVEVITPACAMLKIPAKKIIKVMRQMACSWPFVFS